MCLLLLLNGCTTSYIEFKGECAIQNWTLAGVVLRRRQLCDLPPPSMQEDSVKEQVDELEDNPFPNLFELDNKADTADPNLLEKSLGYPQDEQSEP